MENTPLSNSEQVELQLLIPMLEQKIRSMYHMDETLGNEIESKVDHYDEKQVYVYVVRRIISGTGMMVVPSSFTIKRAVLRVNGPREFKMRYFVPEE